MTYTQLMDHVTRAFELVGVAVLIGGFSLGFVRAVLGVVHGAPGGIYPAVRRSFGRSILLGIEILVAADLIRTVAVAPTLRNVLGLGLIVLIRTFLSFSLEIEIDGVVPWRRARTPAVAGPAQEGGLAAE